MYKYKHVLHQKRITQDLHKSDINHKPQLETVNILENCSPSDRKNNT
jgi:hypothetical protein